MSFLWPQALWLLVAVPVLVVAYEVLQRRRRRGALRLASIDLLRAAQQGAGIRRHLPPLLFLLAIALLVLAVARPRATIPLPSEQRTIILAIDTSLSMRANDISPSRIAVAREAAKAFVREQPDDVRVGIVAFAAQAALVQSPTRDREELTAAIDRLQLQVHTALGSGIIMSLAALFPDEQLEQQAETYGNSNRDRPRAAPLDPPAAPAKQAPVPVAPGSYRSGAIILLTDGRRTIGPDPLAAARLAADHGVKVYTVGFGTETGGTAEVDGRSIFMRFDKETLQGVATLTAAEYFHAGSAADLARVYDGLNARYVLERKPTELTALGAALAILLLLMAGALSVAWTARTS